MTAERLRLLAMAACGFALGWIAHRYRGVCVRIQILERLGAELGENAPESFV